jgi:hypothetical protein
MQAEMLLREEIEKGGDFCGHVVKLAVEVANNIVLASFNTVKRIGLEAITLLHHDLIISADSACTAAHQGMQQLLDGAAALKDSSSTIDLSAATAEQPSGTRSLHTQAICTAAAFTCSITCSMSFISCVHMQVICLLSPKRCTCAFKAIGSSPQEHSCTSNILLTAHGIPLLIATWPLLPEQACRHNTGPHSRSSQGQDVCSV